MSADIVVDLSFAWPSMTAAKLTGHKIAGGQITGAIGYCNNADTRKNVSAARLADWLDNGLMAGLVWEDTARDMLTGSAGGDQRGRDFLKQAKAIGYDTEQCVMAVAADWNTQPSDFGTADAFMNAFKQHIPRAVVYGNARLINHLAGHPGLIEYGWQSDSTSFSPEGPSPHARLLQRYNDPRVAGLPVDANDITELPLQFMGEVMQVDLTPAAQQFIQQTVNGAALAIEKWAHMELAGTEQRVQTMAGELAALVSTGQTDAAAIAAALAPALGPDLGQAIVKELAIQLAKT